MGNKHIKELTGIVVSDKADKTRVVMVKSVRMHPLYKKRFVVRKKYYVHDKENLSKIGDEVKIREIKPISKLKRWSLVEVVKAS
ncbi:MAG: 30S ribosomal protein S17 [bacterium]|nr:30S ribosomal protein S17 [bacterium]